MNLLSIDFLSNNFLGWIFFDRFSFELFSGQGQKRCSWKELVKGRTDFEKVARFNKILNYKNLNDLGMPNGGNGQPLDTPQGSLECLVQTYFDGCQPAVDDYVPDSVLEIDIEVDEVAFITEDWVREAIKYFDDHKAAGLDEFKPIVLKHLGDNMIKRLTGIYKASYILGYIPTHWRESKVILYQSQVKMIIVTQGRSGPSRWCHLMMITMERVVLWHLQETTLLESPLSENQHAFCKGRSTDSVLSNMVEYLEDGIVNGQHAMHSALRI